MIVCGLDEAGRGPLAGPVVAAAVVLDPARPIAGLADSKKLTPARRDALYAEITEKASAWALGRAEVEEIDRINILQAALLAMRRAVEALPLRVDHVLVDGDRIPQGLHCTAEALVGGDGREPCISAASIVAKVSRDREMTLLDRLYPGYGFAGHKGYPTRAHLEALRTLGVTEIHRRSFGPVKRLLELRGGVEPNGGRR